MTAQNCDVAPMRPAAEAAAETVRTVDSTARAAESWIAIRWTSQAIHAWRMAGRQTVLARACMPCDGEAPEYGSSWLRLILPWLRDEAATLVLISRSAQTRSSLRAGHWIEVPGPILSPALTVRVPAADARIDAHCLPGLLQSQPSGYLLDGVTQLAGASRLLPDFDGTICLPGYHSHWIAVSGDRVTGFASFVTGALSVMLWEALVAAGEVHLGGDGWHEAAFRTAVEESLSQPAQVASRFYALHTDALFDDQRAGTLRARLAGMLVGAELAASRPYWHGRQVALVGAAALVETYRSGLAILGHDAVVLDEEEATLRGFAEIRAGLRATP